MAVSSGRVRQRGVALITALLVVTLATIAAVAMANRQQLDIRRTSNVLNADQAWAYAEGVEDWSKTILRRDLDDNKTDHLNEAWATDLAPIPVEGGQILGRLEDLHGRYNINNLLVDGNPSEQDVAYFKRLLVQLELNEELANAVLDWMDANQEQSFPGGAEDVDYLLLDPPYRTADRPLFSVSELAAVKGFTAEVMTILRPLLVALPERTALNVNTADARLLQALVPDMTAAEAETLVAARGNEGYEKLDDFLAEPALAGRPPELELAVAADYFLLDAQVDIGTARTRLYSVLQRNEQGISTLYRSRGAW